MSEDDTMSGKALLIVNPASAGGTTKDDVAAAASRFKRIDVFLSDGVDAMVQRIDKIREGDVERLIVAGGDGTVHCAVNALMTLEARPPLGIIPAGTANDLAHSLGLPTSPAAALDVAMTGQKRRLDLIDLGCAGERYAVNAVTGGLSVEVHEQMDEQTKRWWGGFAYARAMLDAVGQTPDYHVTLESDEGTVEADALGLVLANSPRAGGQVLVPWADSTDGRIEALVALASEGVERLALFAAFAAGEQFNSERVRWLRGRRIRIDADPPMQLIVDGDPGCRTPVTVEVVPGAVEVFVPGAGGR